MLIFWAALSATVILLAGVVLIRKCWPYVQRVVVTIRTLRTLLREARTSIKVLEFYGKPTVKAHFAALGKPAKEDSGPVELSYGLSRLVGLIDPTLIATENNDTIVCTVAIGAEFRKRRGRMPGQPEKLCGFQKYRPWRPRRTATLHGPARSLDENSLIAKLLHAGYKRVLFIDADAMVTNPAFRIEDIFAKLESTNCPVLVTEDEDGINTGVMFVQNISATYRLLDLIWLNDSDIENGTWEQNSLKVLMDASNEIKSLVAIESNPKTINSFPVERNLFHPTRADQIWSHGDFVCHFSGLRTPHLERYIANYATSLHRNAADLSALSQPLAAPQR